MAAGVRVIETRASTAPLGLRFRDMATQALVSGGLRVTAYPAGQPERAVQAPVNRSGVYGFAHLPGLRAWEDADEEDWAAPPERAFTVEVEDPAGRFLACRLGVTGPVRGLAGLACGSPLVGGLESPLASAPAVPLFSSPARAGAAGMAVVRGQLWDAAADRAAAWALVAVQGPQGAAAWGLADERGQVAVWLPYPAPIASSVGSPLGAPAVPLWEQRWLLAVEAYYAAPAGEPAALPDLCDVLQQGPAPLWLVRSPPVLLTEVALRYGEDAVLRSEGAGGELLSVVFVGG